MKLIVGLGNPGSEYMKTRHNAGFLAIEDFARVESFPEWEESRFFGLTTEGVRNGEKIILLKPTTYMNLSGRSVSALMNFYKLDPTTDLLILSDDLDMETGRVRYREKGGSGGQNGLKSIIQCLGTEDFARIKIGIGRDGRYAVSDWVLSRWTPDELISLQSDTFPLIRDQISKWLTR